MTSPDYRRLLDGEIEPEEYVEIVKRDVASELRNTVWIPAVPLPMLGLFSDRCMCGARFRGRGRRKKYELHFRREHEPHLNVGCTLTQVEVTREEASRIYAEVQETEAGEKVSIPVPKRAS